MSRGPLSILVLGSLGPNPERILVLRSLGHQVIYGYTEYLPFIPALETAIHCTALPRGHVGPMVERLIREHQVDVVYSLLNAHDGSTEATIELLDHGIKAPIIRHYKEHPCIPTHEERRVLLETDAQIYINDESREYFRTTYGIAVSAAHVMDGDLISSAFMANSVSLKLRLTDGEPHVLIAGGISVIGDRLDMREFCCEMARRGIHTHVYGYPRGVNQSGMPIVPHLDTLLEYQAIAASTAYVHLHEYISPTQFAEMWSRYDAGMMHARVPSAHEEAQFQRLNFGHRYSAYLAAGLPLLVQQGGQDAMERLVRTERLGLVFRDYDEVSERLRNEQWLAEMTSQVTLNRKRFSFEENVAGLVDFFRRSRPRG